VYRRLDGLVVPICIVYDGDNGRIPTYVVSNACMRNSLREIQLSTAVNDNKPKTAIEIR
jgi:hypothetical protein